MPPHREDIVVNTLPNPDFLALLSLVALTLLALWDPLSRGTVVGIDGAVLYPMGSYLGERLRSGEIPGWQPHVYSGAPFAADPISGWMYLPSMLLFTALPLGAAVGSSILFHFLLAGVGMYLLARVLGLGVAGSLLAAIAYEFSTFMYYRMFCCTPFPGVASWLPLLILTAEQAARSRSPLLRVLWWGLGGLTLSQMLVHWLGQGSYYALLLLGGYLGYRWLVAPPGGVGGPLFRFAHAVLHGGAILLFGFGLAAAGVLPQIEYNALSNLAGGYLEVPSGVTPSSVRLDGALEFGTYYPALAVVALAVVAPVVARRYALTPYWALVALASLVLATPTPTPLHWLLNLLPGFSRLHPHHPGRILLLLYFCLALLAGATLHGISERGGRTRLLALVPGLGIAGLVIASLTVDINVAPAMLIALAAATFLLACPLYRNSRWPATILVLVAVFADLLSAGRAVLHQQLASGLGETPAVLRQVDLNSYYLPDGAARFLGGRDDREVPRYFGYDPLVQGHHMPYPLRFFQAETAALEVNNRAFVTGLHDLQGHGPIHVRRYDEYLAALNGRAQNYHDAFVLPGGLGSPMLDALGARYIIIPANSSPGRDDLQRLSLRYPTVYEDHRVRVLENRAALPRAWIVHSGRQVEPGRALQLLASGEVNPRDTALLEQPPPALARPTNPSADRAEVGIYRPERIRVATETSAPGLLVLSEVYYPAWEAYVDGRRAPLYVADHALRAVPIPAGRHEVELRFESNALRAGMAISTAAYSLFAVLALAAWRAHRRRWPVLFLPRKLAVSSRLRTQDTRSVRCGAHLLLPTHHPSGRCRGDPC